MLTAAQTIARALEIAKAPAYTTQAQQFLNAILSDLCEGYDFAIARGLFSFTFNPSLTSFYGSGPYNLPIDYLRASGSSGEGQKTSFWMLNGVPHPMIPCDLSEFDMQVQQAGTQSYPWLWATDMSNASLATSSRYKAATTANMVAGALVIVLASGINVAAGDGIAGEGIVPGTQIAAISNFTGVTTGDTHTSTLLDNLGSTAGVVIGQTIIGLGIPVGTVVAAILSSSSVTMSQAATATAAGVAITFTGVMTTINPGVAATLTAASVFSGVPPQAYAYPPPSGAYPVTIRYQRQMPPITDLSRYPWFPDDGYLVDELAGRLMEITDDSRVQEFIGNGQAPGRSGRRLRLFLGNLDDKRNRPQTVELDRRRFGGSMRNLPNTKTVGW